jgi:hypothetical protein
VRLSTWQLPKQRRKKSRMNEPRGGCINGDPKVVANGLIEGTKVYPSHHRLVALQQTYRDVSGNEVQWKPVIDL